MLQIKEIEPFPTFFWEAGTESVKNECTGIKSGKMILFNNTEAIHIENDGNQHFQTIICEYDGIMGCGFGSWISVRRYEDYYFFLPDFQFFEAELEWACSEIDSAPPAYIIENGILWFDKIAFAKLSEHIPAFMKLLSIEPLSLVELIKIYRFETYLQIFDKPFPTPKPSNNLKFYSSLPGTIDYINSVNKEFDKLHSAANFKLERISKEDEEVIIPLDSPLGITLKPAVISNNNFHLRIGDFKIIRY